MLGFKPFVYSAVVAVTPRKNEADGKEAHPEGHAPPAHRREKLIELRGRLYVLVLRSTGTGCIFLSGVAHHRHVEALSDPLRKRRGNRNDRGRVDPDQTSAVAFFPSTIPALAHE